MAEGDGAGSSTKTPKHDWYQTESTVTIAFLAKDIDKDTLEIRCDGHTVVLVILFLQYSPVEGPFCHFSFADQFSRD